MLNLNNGIIEINTSYKTFLLGNENEIFSTLNIKDNLQLIANQMTTLKLRRLCQFGNFDKDKHVLLITITFRFHLMNHLFTCHI